MKYPQYVYVNSRQGKFDICHPCKESVNAQIEICHDEPGIMVTELRCLITTKEVVTSTNPDELIEEIDHFLKSVIYTSNEKEILAVRKFLEDNHYQLRYGNAIKEKITHERRLKELNKIIDECIQETSRFEKGVWISECIQMEI